MGRSGHTNECRSIQSRALPSQVCSRGTRDDRTEPMSAPASRIEAVIAEVVRAGAAIEAVRARGFIVRHKGSAGPVTEADDAADAYLREHLPQIIPAAWLSEETVDDRGRLEQDALWIVDPLDGTREFTQGIPEYSIAVAFVGRGVPELAVVHNPATGDVFSAARGAGARRNGRPIRVTEGQRLLASRSEAG